MSDTDTKTLEQEARRVMAEIGANIGDTDYDESNVQLLRQHARGDDGSSVALNYAADTASWLAGEVRRGTLPSYLEEELEERTRKAAVDVAAKNDGKVGKLRERIEEVAKQYHDTVESDSSRNLWRMESNRVEMAAMDDGEIAELAESYGANPEPSQWGPHRINLLAAELRGRGLDAEAAVFKDAVKSNYGRRPYLAHPEMRTAMDDLRMYKAARHGHVPVRIGKAEGQFTYIPLGSIVDKSALRIPPMPRRRRR